jgi:hypothetical protein
MSFLLAARCAGRASIQPASVETNVRFDVASSEP